MRYRKLDANGDYSFGHGAVDFYINSPDGVAQAVKTRLALLQGEWFLDTQEGTPYATQILGTNTQNTYDIAIRSRILGTQGVNELIYYQSSINNRSLSVYATIDTIYGPTSISVTL
jgi:hypothetical protein